MSVSINHILCWKLIQRGYPMARTIKKLMKLGANFDFNYFCRR